MEAIIGADEVGRGALAGPVVAAAVSFAANHKSQITNDKQIVIRDSKKMTARQREISDKWIRKNALVGIGEGSVLEIEKYGIVGATNRAFRRAIYQLFDLGLEPVRCRLQVDAFYVPRLRGIPKSRQEAIIKGDQKIFSISAASIVAKVYRDNLMTELSNSYRQYFWHKNKGYGTLAHKQSIEKHGITGLHRKSFLTSLAFSQVR